MIINDQKAAVAAISDSYTYISTPNTPNSVFVWIVSEDMSQSEKEYYDYVTDSAFVNAYRLSSSTRKYNCHSYAWYSQDVSTNTYWMNDPSMFYNDYSYCEVSSPQIGDIICYFDDMGTANVSDDINLHSGIITEFVGSISNNECGDSNLVEVVSKWGDAGLYRHNGYECPYTSYAGGEADYVRYFRETHQYYYTYTSSNHSLVCGECGHVKTVEPHSITTHVPYDNDKHKGFCVCGYTNYTVHIISPTSGKVGTCIICGATVLLSGNVIMPYSINNPNYVTDNGSYALSNGVIILSEYDYQMYLEGILDIYELIYGDS